MVRFIQMVELAKTEPFMGRDELSQDFIKRRFEEMAAEAQVFVFELSKSLTMEELRVPPSPKASDRSLGFPFPVCSFESFGKPLLETVGNLTSTDETVRDMFEIESMLVREVGPGQFEYFTMSRVDGKPPRIWYSDQNIQFASRFLDVFLAEIEKGEIGQETTPAKVRIGTGSAKRDVKIRRIIHIVSKRARAAGKKGLSKEIDFSHRWLVRGHWRAHQGLGKDRNGTYCIENYTWVTEHQKGPEDKPLVANKVRLVKARAETTD